VTKQQWRENTPRSVWPR